MSRLAGAVRSLGSTDPVVAGRRLLVAAAALLAVGGGIAMVMRWQAGWPGAPVPLAGALLFPASGGAVPQGIWASLTTSHGLIMVYFAATPATVGLAHALLPGWLDVPGLAFPRLVPATVLTFVAGASLAVVSLLQPGTGLMIEAVLLASCAFVMGGVNVIATMATAEPQRRRDAPLTAWGAAFAGAVHVGTLPVLITSGGLLLLDRRLGTDLFAAGGLGTRGGADPVLFEHPVWLLGHPAVFALVLPAWGIVGDLLADLSGRPARGRRATVSATGAAAALCCVVYAHHVVVGGASPLIGRGFAVLTLLLALPAQVVAVGWVRTAWGGAWRWSAATLFGLGAAVTFVIGGLSGLGMATAGHQLHGTVFVVGHLHLTLSATVLMAAYAAAYRWSPELLGSALGEGLGRAHFALTLAGALAVFGGLLWLGWEGALRRTWDPLALAPLRPLAPVHRAVSWVAFGLAAAQLLPVANALISRRKSLRPAP